jgi:hypothetical protein
MLFMCWSELAPQPGVGTSKAGPYPRGRQALYDRSRRPRPALAAQSDRIPALYPPRAVLPSIRRNRHIIIAADGTDDKAVRVRIAGRYIADVAAGAHRIYFCAVKRPRFQ